MAADDVQLPDLEVIQRFSLAVRSATAPREDVVAALQADLAWLTGDGAAAASGTRAQPPAKEAATPKRPGATPAAPPRKRTARRAVPRTAPTSATPTAPPDAEA